jgi:hypothetical protein
MEVSPDGEGKGMEEVDWGDYAATESAGLLIIGRVWTLEEVESGEREAGAPEEELRYTVRMMKDAHHRGYRFGEYMSEPYPDGELGSHHVSRLRKITKQQYNQVLAMWRGASGRN